MPLGENTRFLAALEIEVGFTIDAIYPSLRFGMTRVLRRLCLKEASAFNVPKRNDRVILPVPPYAGSSPANKNLRAGESYSRDVSKGDKTSRELVVSSLPQRQVGSPMPRTIHLLRSKM